MDFNILTLGVQQTHIACMPTDINTFLLFNILYYVLGQNFCEMITSYTNSLAFQYIYYLLFKPLHSIHTHTRSTVTKFYHTNLLSLHQLLFLADVVGAEEGMGTIYESWWLDPCNLQALFQGIAVGMICGVAN